MVNPDYIILEAKMTNEKKSLITNNIFLTIGKWICVHNIVL